MTNRRQFLQMSGAAMLAGAMPASAQEYRRLKTRPIPGTGDSLAIIGLGNSQAFRSGNLETSRKLLEIFLGHGGNYVDGGGADGAIVARIGRETGARDQLFIGNYIDPGEPPALKQGAMALADGQGNDRLDLVHTRDLQGFRSGHGGYRALKEDGLARFIGVARTGVDSHDAMASLIEDGLVDFIQVNYSMLEPEAAERLLPLARDNEVGVAISRPFINGNYFRIVSGHDLPAWAAEFDCASWAQFSLKFILANPAVTCVLTETANPDHAIDNLGAGFGRLPDEAMRRRMLEHMRSLV